ncbi:related to GNAT family N-acetyltransferase [Fusarium torulosum]|uniref:Related to GNAT family N-acetyltransferase n=1 Tax=Fusarium torulosum TaxID=33205 RepID=A0AAE8SFI9_9HYPO|nr:related to GNAT family N-acetyltransferase [Fusarium torulosum]
MPTMMKPQNWTRGDYVVSTDPALLQVDAINAALSSDIVWWAGDLPADALWDALQSSICFGLYHKKSTDMNGDSKTPDGKAGQLEQVGLVRVITDGVTFGYLTDVYILPDHQGGGHGRWMLEILNEVLQSWPHLRRVMLLTTDKMHLFGKNLGMKDYREFDGMKGVSIAMVEGPGAQH